MTRARLAKSDVLPALTPLIVAAIAAPFFGSFSTFVTLTLASLAMGAMLFVMASGLTLAFGLMDVLNFGHGAFIAVGAFVAAMVYGAAPQGSVALDIAVFAAALAAAALVCGALGLVYERLLIAPVYGRHLEQILITLGGSIVVEQLLLALFGTEPLDLSPPAAFRGSLVFGRIAIEKYRLVALGLGLLLYGAQLLALGRTRIGLLIRAGVENREMVRRSAIASTGCSSGYSWRPRRSPASAACCGGFIRTRRGRGWAANCWCWCSSSSSSAAWAR